MPTQNDRLPHIDEHSSAVAASPDVTSPAITSRSPSSRESWRNDSASILTMPLFGQDHVDRYRATDGEEGHDWQGTQTLLLTTTGRKSGAQRTTPLIYAPHGNDAYMIVASKGGSDAPPAWYLNLSENPEVEVQVKGERFKARARTASPDEKPGMWRTMTSEWPAYDAYQRSTNREIPIVVLERA